MKMKDCGSCKFAGYRYCEKLDAEVVSTANGFYANGSLTPVDCCEYWGPKYSEPEDKHINTYRLTPKGKSLTWDQWKSLGGCGLSSIAYCTVCKKHGVQIFTQDGLTLGDIVNGLPAVERELARFAAEHRVLGYSVGKDDQRHTA